MELMSVSKKIEEKIALLETNRGLLEERAKKKAEMIGAYDLALSKSIIKLKSEGNPTTIIEKLAKGECYQALIDKTLAEEMYRNSTTAINSIMAELMGYQSIHKYQKEM